MNMIVDTMIGHTVWLLSSQDDEQRQVEREREKGGRCRRSQRKRERKSGMTLISIISDGAPLDFACLCLRARLSFESFCFLFHSLSRVSCCCCRGCCSRCLGRRATDRHRLTHQRVSQAGRQRQEKGKVREGENEDRDNDDDLQEQDDEHVCALVSPLLLSSLLLSTIAAATKPSQDKRAREAKGKQVAQHMALTPFLVLSFSFLSPSLKRRLSWKHQLSRH